MGFIQYKEKYQQTNDMNASKMVAIHLTLQGIGNRFNVECCFTVGGEYFYLKSNKYVNSFDMKDGPYTLRYKLENGGMYVIDTKTERYVPINEAREIWEIMCKDGFYQGLG